MERKFWIVATDAEAARLWTKRTSPGRNPFTAAAVNVAIVETIDTRALRAWPNPGSLDASPWQLLLLAGANPADAIAGSDDEDDEYSRSVARLPTEWLARVAKTDVPTLVRSWVEWFEGESPSSPAGLFRSQFNEATVTEIRRLACEAVARDATVWCFAIQE